MKRIDILSMALSTGLIVSLWYMSRLNNRLEGLEESVLKLETLNQELNDLKNRTVIHQIEHILH